MKHTLTRYLLQESKQSSGECGSGWMMNRNKEGTKFFFNTRSMEYLWCRTDDVVRDNSLLTKDEIQVSYMLVLCRLFLVHLSATGIHCLNGCLTLQFIIECNCKLIKHVQNLLWFLVSVLRSFSYCAYHYFKNWLGISSVSSLQQP